MFPLKIYEYFENKSKRKRMLKLFGKNFLTNKKLKLVNLNAKARLDYQEEDLKQVKKGKCDPFLPCEICLFGGCLSSLYGCWNRMFCTGQNNGCCGFGMDCEDSCSNCCCCNRKRKSCCCN